MASSSTTEGNGLPDIGATSNQPERHSFPKCSFGKSKVVQRGFQASWFLKWQWLHYVSSQDVAFCHTCVTAIKSGKLKVSGNVKDCSFIYGGFYNWKDATRLFNGHESSNTHEHAVEIVIILPKTTGKVGEMLSSTLSAQKRTSRQYMWKVAQSVNFLARQGIPLRGDGNERDSNFMQLLYLCGADDPQFLAGLQQPHEDCWYPLC